MHEDNRDSQSFNHGKIDPVALYNIFRNYVVVENQLINNRLNWLLAIQGFLFTALGVSLSVRNQLPEELVLKILLCITFMGIATSLFTLAGILGAHDALDKLSKQWKQIQSSRSDMSELPRLRGGGKYNTANRRKRDTGRLNKIANFGLSLKANKAATLGRVPNIFIPLLSLLVWLMLYLSVLNL